MIIPITLMLVGFVSLYYGAEWLVEGAIKIALTFKISKVVVGLVLVAFGTSSPELVVNFIAATNGRTGIALSNVSGSNLTNLCVGFGICALVGILVVDKKKFAIDLTYFALTPGLILLFMLWTPGIILPLWSALPLLILFAFYLYFLSRRAYDEESEVDDTPSAQLGGGIVWFLVGGTALYLGGELVVRNAINLGEQLGISEAILGLTVVAFGTSIPDTMASIAAVRKSEIDIAVGNLLGSNIFNVLLVLGGTLIFAGQGLVADQGIALDYGLVSIASLLFIGLISLSPRISRFSGTLLVLVYLGYMLYRVLLALSFFG